MVASAAGKYIDHRQKGVGVHIVLQAYFPYGLFAKAMRYAKAAHDKKHGIIVADQVTHFIGCGILLLFVHVCKDKKKKGPRILC